MADNLNQYPELVKVLTKIGKNVKSTYQSNLKEKNKYASGKLYNSIDYRIELTNKGCKLYFVADKHYINIENGRKAGGKMPPVEAIKRWMSLKNIKPKNGQSLNGTAFMISRSIQREGIKPSPFLRNIKRNLKDWTDDIKMAINKDLNIEVKKISTKIQSIQGNKHIQFKKK